MKKIKTFYWLDKPNFGDALNINILNSLFGVEVIKTKPEYCEATFIGSTLDDFLYNFWTRKKYDKYYNTEPIKIWGSGFIAEQNKFCYRPFNLPEQYFRQASVYAVRGKLSRTRLSNILGKDFSNIPLADPGLLVSDLIVGHTTKKYAVGIIPHFLENTLPVFDYMNSKISDSVIINMTLEVEEILSLISECEVIISSALHGLIAADSLNIPNIRLKASKKVNGGDYKFNDYYSSYDLNGVRSVTPNVVSMNGNIVEFIKANYMIKPQIVSQKKESLYKSFPF